MLTGEVIVNFYAQWKVPVVSDGNESVYGFAGSNCAIRNIVVHEFVFEPLVACARFGDV